MVYFAEAREKVSKEVVLVFFPGRLLDHGPKCLIAFQFAGLLNFAAMQGHGSRTCVDVDLVVMNEATFASRNRRL